MAVKAEAQRGDPRVEYRYLEGDDMELRAEKGDDDEAVIVRGYAAVFGKYSVDLGGFREVIEPGAFADSLRNKDIRALWGHDTRKPLGRLGSGTLELEEDERGLRVAIHLPDSSWGRDARIAIERRDVHQMSFGFRVAKEGQTWEEDEKGKITRTLKKVELLEVSPVTFPAYRQTSVRDVSAMADEFRSELRQNRARVVRRRMRAELEQRND